MPNSSEYNHKRAYTCRFQGFRMKANLGTRRLKVARILRFPSSHRKTPKFGKLWPLVVLFDYIRHNIKFKTLNSPTCSARIKINQVWHFGIKIKDLNKKLNFNKRCGDFPAPQKNPYLSQHFVKVLNHFVTKKINQKP